MANENPINLTITESKADANLTAAQAENIISVIASAQPPVIILPPNKTFSDIKQIAFNIDKVNNYFSLSLSF